MQDALEQRSSSTSSDKRSSMPIPNNSNEQRKFLNFIKKGVLNLRKIKAFLIKTK